MVYPKGHRLGGLYGKIGKFKAGKNILIAQKSLRKLFNSKNLDKLLVGNALNNEIKKIVLSNIESATREALMVEVKALKKIGISVPQKDIDWMAKQHPPNSQFRGRSVKQRLVKWNNVNKRAIKRIKALKLPKTDELREIRQYLSGHNVGQSAFRPTARLAVSEMNRAQQQVGKIMGGYLRGQGHSIAYFWELSTLPNRKLDICDDYAIGQHFFGHKFIGIGMWSQKTKPEYPHSFCYCKLRVVLQEKAREVVGLKLTPLVDIRSTAKALATTTQKVAPVSAGEKKVAESFSKKDVFDKYKKVDVLKYPEEWDISQQALDHIMSEANKAAISRIQFVNMVDDEASHYAHVAIEFFFDPKVGREVAVRTVSVNTNWFKGNLEALFKSVQKTASSGFHQLGNEVNPVRSILTHEKAHMMVQASDKGKKAKKLRDAYKKFTEEIGGEDKIFKHISQYATTNVDEAIAEAYGSYKTGVKLSSEAVKFLKDSGLIAQEAPDFIKAVPTPKFKVSNESVKKVATVVKSKTVLKNIDDLFDGWVKNFNKIRAEKGYVKALDEVGDKYLKELDKLSPTYRYSYPDRNDLVRIIRRHQKRLKK